VTEQEEPQRPAGRADRLFGAAAEPTEPRPPRERAETPGSLRGAALLVGLEAAASGVLAVVWAWLVVTGAPEHLANAIAEVVIIALFAVGLGAASRGLWRVSSWARGPVVAAQIFLGLTGYVTAFEAQRPLIGVPILAVVVAVIYLLATPESRLAYFR
jgi:hypothetical protein